MHRRFVNVCFVCAFALLPCPRSVRAQGWSTGLGGNSQRSGFVQTVGPSTGMVAWRAALGGGYARQPVIDSDRVFASECDSSCANDLVSTIALTRVVARDLRTGALLWSASVPMANSSDGYASVIGAHAGLVFVTRSNNSNALSGPIYALREDDGSLAWTSQESFGFCVEDSPAYADNGDLIVGATGVAVRIRASDGATVWDTPVETDSCPSSAAVAGAAAYVHTAPASQRSITRLDVDTGKILYSAPQPVSGQLEATEPLIGPSGMVYLATFTGEVDGTGLLTAYRDTGNRFDLMWQAPLPAGLFYESFAVAPDGSVYSYSTDHRVVRLDPASGAILAQSSPLPWDNQYGAAQPSMAVDARGCVYVGTHAGSLPSVESGIFAFDRNLVPLWTDLGVGLMFDGGIALASDGSLVVPAYANSPFGGLQDYRGPKRVTAQSAPSAAPVIGRGGR